MIGDGGEVPTPMSELAGVAGEVSSSLQREDSELVGVGFRADGDGVIMIRGWIWRKAGNILYNGASFGWLVHGDEFPEEFSVPECLPDPSILMRYWWNWRTLMTIPVRSHLFG